MTNSTNSGKHAGFYEHYKNKPIKEIKKGVKSLEKQICEHNDKISNPTKYLPNFYDLDERQQNALIHRKWPADIKRQTEQKQLLEDILQNLER